MALYNPHSIFHLAWLLYVRPEKFRPYYVHISITDKTFKHPITTFHHQGIFKYINIPFFYIACILYISTRVYLIILNVFNYSPRDYDLKHGQHMYPYS